MTQVQCRSYSALEFDGCPACADAALAATGQAAVYVLGRAALGLPSDAGRPIEVTYVLNIRLVDDDDKTIASDEIRAEQTISAVPVDDDRELADEEFDDIEPEEGSMRLEDFQTVLDRLELAPLGNRGLCGKIAGRLYGFERSIGRFEVDVAPTR